MTRQRQNTPKIDIWDYVEKELHAKLSTVDAWQMAQNLGVYIVENCGSLSPQKMIRKVFIDAFGEDIGESKIKNRSRWVVLPKEVGGRSASDLKANQLARSGGDLKQLAKVLLPSKPSYLELLVKGTTMEPPYLKVAVSDTTGFDLIETICASISKKYNLVDYYKTLIGYGIGWKQFDPNLTNVQTINRAVPRIRLKDDIYSNYDINGKVVEVKKYEWPVGFSLSDKASVYSDLDYILSKTHYDENFDIMALAPTMFLGNLYLPVPIFKVNLPKEIAAKKWLLESKDTSDEYSKEFKKAFGHFPFFNEKCRDYDEHGDGIKIQDFAFKYDHCRKEYDEWANLIRRQSGDYKISFAAGYSVHRICLMLLPNTDGTKILPRILVTEGHIISTASYAALLSKEVKNHNYSGDRELYLTDNGQTCFFHTTLENEWYHEFSKFASLIQACFPVNSPSGNSFLSQICDKQGAWLREVGLNDLFDNYNPVFYPSFDYKTETLINSPEASIIGKLHRHLLSNQPEDCIFAELDKEAKAFTDNLSHFLKGYLQKKSKKEEALKAYFEK